MTHAISWVEIPSTDFERAVDFYTTVLNREIDVYEPEPEDVDNGRAGMFHTEEGEVGGMIVEVESFTTESGATIRYAPTADSGPVVYLSVEDVDDALARAESVGGEVLVGKESVPDMGHYAILKDTEGNRIGLFSTS